MVEAKAGAEENQPLCNHQHVLVQKQNVMQKTQTRMEAEECVEEHHDHEDDMESEDPPAEENKKPSSKRAAKKAKVAPMKSQDYSTSSLTFQYLNSTPFSNSNHFMHACLQELKPSQFDLDVKAFNEEIPDPLIFVPEAVIEGQKKCCS